MKNRNVVICSAAAVLGLALLPGNAIGQQKPLKEQIVGTWTYAVNETIRPDGSTITGDELKYIVAAASAGDGRAEVTLRRAK